MNVITQIYIQRKRFKEHQLIKIQEIVENEINRRIDADKKNINKN